MLLVIKEEKKEEIKEEKLSLEELYQLIEEIKKDEEEYQKIVQERKENRLKNNSEIKVGNKFIFLSAILLATHITNSTFLLKNPFRNNKLFMSPQKQKEILAELEEKLDIQIPLEEQENYILLNSVFSNDNLTLEEQKEIFNLLPLLNDNENINKQALYSTLENLKIDYTSRPDIIDNSVVGLYFFPLHSINIYVSKEEDKNKDILNHEKIHSIYTNGLNIAIPRFLCEGMTELLENEYFSKTPFLELSSYIYEVNFVKLLCELTGEDIILKAYTTGNANYIYDKLDSIYGSKGDAKEIITKIDEIFAHYFDTSYSFSKEELKNLLTSLENYYVEEDKETLKGLNEYGYLKYDKRIKNSAFYYYENLLLSATYEDRYSKYLDYLDTVGTLEKAYFSSELKEKLLKEDSKILRK